MYRRDGGQVVSVEDCWGLSEFGRIRGSVGLPGILGMGGRGYF